MTLVAAAMATTMNAQGFIGGKVGYSHFSNDDTRANTWTIAPEFGFAISDDWTFGIAIGYETSKGYEFDETSKKDDVTRSGFSIAPYLRYTIARLDKVNFFTDFGFNYKHGRTTKDDAIPTAEFVDGTFVTGTKDKSDDFNSWGLGIYPGLAVNLNSKLSFVTKIGLVEYFTEHYCGSDDTDKGFNLGIDGTDLQFSVYYNF